MICVEQFLHQILSELKDIKNNQSETNNRLGKIEEKLIAAYSQRAELEGFRTETNEKFNKLDDKINNLLVDVNNLSVKTVNK